MILIIKVLVNMIFMTKCKGMSFYSATGLLYDSQPIKESTDSLNIPWTKGSGEVSENVPGAVHGGSLD